MTLSFSNTAPGQRYVLVHAIEPPTPFGNSSGNTFSDRPYSLSVSFVPTGVSIASLVAAVFDRDRVGFSVPVAVFDAFSLPREEEGYRPPGAADLKRFEGLVQYQNSVGFHPVERPKGGRAFLSILVGF